jgi:hypothetical protein
MAGKLLEHARSSSRCGVLMEAEATTAVVLGAQFM